MADRKIQRSITIDPELLQRAEEYGERHSRSVSYLIEQALWAYMAKAHRTEAKQAKA